MSKKEHVFLAGVLLFVLLMPSASAARTIDNPRLYFNLSNASVTFPTSQGFDNITTRADAITLNGYELKLTPSSQTDVKINSFDTASDQYNITFSGTGTTTLSQHVKSSNTDYNFFLAGSYAFKVTSNATGWISKTGIVAGTYTYPSQYVAPPAPGGGGGGDAGKPTPTPLPTPKPTPDLINQSTPFGNVTRAIMEQDFNFKPPDLSAPVWMGVLYLGAGLGFVILISGVPRGEGVIPGRVLGGLVLLIGAASELGWLN